MGRPPGPWAQRRALAHDRAGAAAATRAHAPWAVAWAPSPTNVPTPHFNQVASVQTVWAAAGGPALIGALLILIPQALPTLVPGNCAALAGDARVRAAPRPIRDRGGSVSPEGLHRRAAAHEPDARPAETVDGLSTRPTSQRINDSGH